MQGARCKAFNFACLSHNPSGLFHRAAALIAITFVHIDIELPYLIGFRWKAS